MDTNSHNYKEWLDTIANTRLVFNSLEEYEKFYGHNFQGNGITRIFASKERRRSAYRDMKVEVEEQTDGYINLDTLMADYKQAWEFYKENLSRRSCPSEIALQLLSHIYPPHTYKTRNETKRAIFQQAVDEGVDVVLLLLLIMKALPGYWSKNGEVKNIGKSFEVMTELFENYTQANPFFSELPCIKDAMEEKNKTRIMLIYHVSRILDTYVSYCDDESIYETASDIKDVAVNLDIAGLWNTCGGLSNSTEFWQIEEAINDGTYFLTHWCKDANLNLWGTRYTLFVIKNAKGSLTFYIVHPKAIEKRVNNSKLSDDDNAWYFTSMTDGHPDRLPLMRAVSTKSAEWEASLDLTRCNEEATALYSKWLDGGCKKMNRYERQEYFMKPDVYAITRTHIYIVSEKEGEFYKVPRDAYEGFEHIRLDDNVGTMTMGGKVYLAFDEFLLYIMTDKKTLQEYGIERVKSIE